MAGNTDVAAARYTVVSADGHAGADLLDYRPYLESKYHEQFDAWAATYVNPYEDLLHGDAERNWDSARRLADLERDGIVAEVLFPNTIPPFYPSMSLSAQQPSAEEYELRWAGLRAHNRWMADFCGQAPGRRAGTCQVLLGNMGDAVAEVRWAREHGLFGGVLLPGTPPGTSVPQLYSDVYEPLWAVCEELDMPVNHHAGSASPEIGQEPAGRAVFMMEITWFAHRALWHLIYGGAFKRHPGLKFVLTEQGSGWVPGVLEMLDYYHRALVRRMSSAMDDAGAVTAESRFGAGIAEAVGLAPSEYWKRNFFLGASFMRPDEVPLRHAIGLEKLMWGSDYPHDEGTFPYSREALRNSFAGLPHAEIAAILGGNAARVYGFDLAALDRIAAAVGPTAAEIDEPLQAPPAEATSPTFGADSVIRVW